VELYGEMDKRTIKIKKAVALALLKNNRNEEALKELLETEVIINPFNQIVATTNQLLWRRFSSTG
jgi:hypothetical protein